MTGRSVTEWIGRSPDSAIPQRVRARVFDRHGGICHISKRKIMPGETWDCDHVIALKNGGENRENNLAPALTAPHKDKTKADVKEKSIIARKRGKHIGTIRAKGQIKSAGFPKQATRQPKQTPPRRAIYEVRECHKNTN